MNWHYFFPFQSFRCDACPRKKSHVDVCAPCTSCSLFVLQYLSFIILCLFLESWRFWSSSDNSYFWNTSTQAQSLFTKGVICTKLSNKSHTCLLCVWAAGWISYLYNCKTMELSTQMLLRHKQLTQRYQSSRLKVKETCGFFMTLRWILSSD